jgi:hypothetical protein
MLQNDKKHWQHNRENSPYQVNKLRVKLYKQM